MSLFKKIKNTFSPNNKLSEPILDIKTSKLKHDIEFILHNLPIELVSGLVFIEDVFERAVADNEIFVQSTMSPVEIKREIGKIVYNHKRWDEQEEIARKLLAEEKIDLNLFENVYNTTDYIETFSYLTADVFAVYYGNDTMTLDEISIAINSLYIKNFAEEQFSGQKKIENLVNDLFDNKND